MMCAKSSLSNIITMTAACLVALGFTTAASAQMSGMGGVPNGIPAEDQARQTAQSSPYAAPTLGAGPSAGTCVGGGENATDTLNQATCARLGGTWMFGNGGTGAASTGLTSSPGRAPITIFGAPSPGINPAPSTGFGFDPNVGTALPITPAPGATGTQGLAH